MRSCHANRRWSLDDHHHLFGLVHGGGVHARRFDVPFPWAGGVVNVTVATSTAKPIDVLEFDAVGRSERSDVSTATDAEAAGHTVERWHSGCSKADEV